MTKEIQIDLSDLEIDTGYGDCQADLSVDVELNYHEAPMYSDTRGDFGKGVVLDSVRIIGGSFFLIDQDGGNCGEQEYNGEYDETIKEEAEKVFYSGRLAL